MLNTGQKDTYWIKVNGKDLSSDFKQLIEGLFSFDGNKRPTLD